MVKKMFHKITSIATFRWYKLCTVVVAGSCFHCIYYN